jgi:hypothetical protein
MNEKAFVSIRVFLARHQLHPHPRRRERLDAGAGGRHPRATTSTGASSPIAEARIMTRLRWHRHTQTCWRRGDSHPASSSSKVWSGTLRLPSTVAEAVELVELAARSGNRAAPMGGGLILDRRGEDLEVVLRVRVPLVANGGGVAPQLHPVDLIAGDITQPVTDRGRI